jgi:hypothetical protein
MERGGLCGSEIVAQLMIYDGKESGNDQRFYLLYLLLTQ